MESIVKSDLFFFVTGLSVILVTLFWLILIAIVSYFGYKILKNLRTISSIVKDQTEKISSDADKMREDMGEVGKEAKTSIMLLFKVFNAVSKKLTESKKRSRKIKNKK